MGLESERQRSRQLESSLQQSENASKAAEKSAAEEQQRFTSLRERLQSQLVNAQREVPARFHSLAGHLGAVVFVA